MSKKPNILIIWGDDIGITNLSCYSDGLMGYHTPILTASPTKALSSPMPTASRVAPPADQPSSPGKAPTAQV
jgi:arylsulfatase A-like enzyme